MHFETFHDAIKLCGHRWTTEIMAALQQQPMRFTELIRSIDPTPSPKSLNEALHRLQDQQLVERGAQDPNLYRLTAAGQHLLPLMTAFVQDLQRWTDTYRERRTPQRCQRGE